MLRDKGCDVVAGLLEGGGSIPAILAGPLECTALMPDQTNPSRLVLIVEDELLIRMMVVDSLLDGGIDVIEASAGEEAMKILDARKTEIGAVILDVGLPDIKGDSLVARIRAVVADMPIIVTTGYDITELVKRFQADSRVRVLAKPYQPEALGTLLKEWGIGV